MYSANRFPVMLHEGGAVGYAEGGLHDEAMAVRKAGRNGDSRLVHVNDDEFEQMKAQYGEPTINPETGMPEFFLGGLVNILKAIAPIAASFIPGVGPILAPVVGAGLGALDGGGLKGALLGGVSGALGGAGVGSQLGTKLGSSILGQSASGAAKNALGSAVIGGAMNGIAGGDPLQGALASGLTSYLGTKMQEGAPAPTSTTATPTAAPATMAAPTTASAAPPTLSVSPAPTTASAAATAAAKTAAAPNFWNKDFLGLGVVKNKYAIPGIIGAAALADALAPKEDTSMPSKADFFDPTFSAKLGNPGGFKLASVAGGSRPESAAAEYAKKYFSGYADGGDVEEGHGNFAVRGPGTGRSDNIPAMLSDGEYVMDAETVSMLGDGSTKAGAKKLDDFRVKIRKQKGSKLAKGKISHDAKAPEKYMAGGRI